MIQIGRTVIMEQSNCTPDKNTYGKVLGQADSKKINVLWEDGSVSTVPEFWLGTFSCDDKLYNR